MRPRYQRSAAVLIVVGLVVLAAPLAVWGQTSTGSDEPSFTGFSLEADASGMSIIFGDPSSQPYPLATGIVPETLATLSTGPTGFAQASAAWPGPLASNAGSLAGLLLPLCVPNGQGVCTPKPDSNTTNLVNYPVRAEASSPVGRSEESLGPLSARSHGNASAANATITDFSSAGLVSSGRVSSASKSFTENGTVTSIGETVLSGVSAAGGAVKIDSIRTIAQVVTDGIKATRTRQITVSGLEIGGQKATVDEHGVHFGAQGTGNPLDGAVDQANKQIASGFGMQMFLTKPLDDTDKDGTVRLNTGSLGIVWKPPGSGYQAIITLGGAGVVVQATPSFTLAVPGLSGATDLPAVGAGGAAVGGTGGALPAGGTEGLSLGATTSPSGASPARGSTGATTLANERLTTHVGFDGIALALVLAALVGAVLAGFGLGRLQLLALDPRNAATCQNGGRR